MKLNYSSEVKSELNQIVQKAYVECLKDSSITSQNVENFHSKILLGCRNLAFDNDMMINLIARTEDTLIAEIIVCRLDSIFLHCYLRQRQIYCVMYSTYDDAQVELLKTVKDFTENPMDKIAELHKLRTQNKKLIEEKTKLQRKLDAYNGHELIETLQDIINKVKEYEGIEDGQ